MSERYVYFRVLATRRIGDCESRFPMFFRLALTWDGPQRMKERLADEISEQYTFDWDFKVDILTDFEYCRGLRELRASLPEVSIQD